MLLQLRRTKLYEVGGHEHRGMDRPPPWSKEQNQGRSVLVTVGPCTVALGALMTIYLWYVDTTTVTAQNRVKTGTWSEAWWYTSGSQHSGGSGRRTAMKRGPPWTIKQVLG